MTTKPIAFLTMENLEGYFTYDKLVSDILEQRGWTVDYVPWRGDVAWAKYSHAVIRSTWDYQNHVEEFLATLRRIEQAGVKLLNPVKVVEWNLNKSYLLELESKGVPIVPTLHGKNITLDELPVLAGKLKTDELILKPLFGANADGIFRIPAPYTGNVARDAVAHYRDSEYFAQPFLSSIIDEGEISLFYYLGKYCNAIRKSPKKGDFRVQEEHGGLIEPFAPDADILATGAKALAAVPYETLYARVDLARCPNGKMGLMEVEVIEPSLYFNMDPQAPITFSDALECMIAGE